MSILCNTASTNYNRITLFPRSYFFFFFSFILFMAFTDKQVYAKSASFVSYQPLSVAKYFQPSGPQMKTLISREQSPPRRTIVLRDEGGPPTSSVHRKPREEINLALETPRQVAQGVNAEDDERLSNRLLLISRRLISGDHCSTRVSISRQMPR